VVAARLPVYALLYWVPLAAITAGMAKTIMNEVTSIARTKTVDIVEG
jgi:hypothetical protein